MSEDMDIGSIMTFTRAMRRYELLAADVDRKNKELEEQIKKATEATMLVMNAVRSAQFMMNVLNIAEAPFTGGLSLIGLGATVGMSVMYESKLSGN